MKKQSIGLLLLKIFAIIILLYILSFVLNSKEGFASSTPLPGIPTKKPTKKPS